MATIEERLIDLINSAPVETGINKKDGYLKMSPDGTLFCSANKNDKLVKVWYDKNKSFSFIYLAHPAPITGIEWRRTTKQSSSKHTIPNVLMTSSEDNLSRLWVQDLYDYSKLYGDIKQPMPTLLRFHLGGVIESADNICQATDDVVFSINKLDGSIQLWQIRNLDCSKNELYRHIQIDKLIRLDTALPHYETITMSLNVSYLDVKQSNPAIISNHKTSSDKQSSNIDTTDHMSLNSDTTSIIKQTDGSNMSDKENIEENLNEDDSLFDSNPEIYFITQHLNGILCLWKMNFVSTIPKIESIDLVTRITGQPIDPAWLQDGVLNVIYDEDLGALKTDWSEENSDGTDSFRASEMAGEFKLLPQYHVDQLVELLAFGKLQRVKAILNNVVNCLSESENEEVTSIKPLPLYDLIEADVEKAKEEDTVKKTNKREEFSMQDFESYFQARSQVNETLDEILGETTLGTLQRQKSLKRKKEAALDKSLTNFNPAKAKLLTRFLTHTHLPGLSSLDQMHLLAIADAIALFDATPSDYEEIQEEDSGYGSPAEAMGAVIPIDSLDDRGLKFLTAMRQHVYLSRSLPIKQKTELQAKGIGNHNLVWAFHSETQDELISLIPCVNRNKPQWAELREYGIGWWLKKIEVLRKLIEKVAQSAYQARQDPLDAALFYLAMKKKTLVCALLRRINCDKRLLRLFEQDFNDPANRKKALKNAYALLGLHRFEHAAAFFILAGSIWDAVEVCINNLNDIQLAIVLIRLHDTESNIPPSLRRLLFTEILGSNESAKAHPDSFLRSMAFWTLRDYLSAVHTLLDYDGNSASLVIFYRYLKEHPLVSKHKQQLLEEVELKKRSTPVEEEPVHSHRARSLSSGELTFDEQALTRAVRQSTTEFEVLNETIALQIDRYSNEAVTKKERLLFFATAHACLDAGSPLLALEVMCKEEHLDVSRAQRLKFIACLHILMNELNTVVDFKEWLTKNVQALNKICSYDDTENDPLLRTMLVYCNMHSANEERLYKIRSELLGLLTKKASLK